MVSALEATLGEKFHVAPDGLGQLNGAYGGALLGLSREETGKKKEKTANKASHILSNLFGTFLNIKHCADMDPEIIRKYCLEKKAVAESFPFGESTLVFKVCGKIFLLLSLDDAPLQFNVKCDPEQAESFRETYSSVLPGYHMNKKHWNTVILNGNIPARVIWEMIDASYSLVIHSLPLKERKKADP